MEKYDFSRWKLFRMSWHVLFPYHPRWIGSIYILLCFLPSFFLLELYDMELLRAKSEKTEFLVEVSAFFLCIILAKITIYRRYLVDLFLGSAYDCCGIVKKIDRYEQSEYLQLTLLSNEKQQQYWVYGPLRNLFPAGLKQKKIHFFYLQRSKIIVSSPRFRFDGKQSRDLPDSPLFSNQVYAGLSDYARTEYAEIVKRYVYHGPARYLFLAFPAIIWLVIARGGSIKITLFSIPFLIIGYLIFMKIMMKKETKDILIGLECASFFLLGESVSKDQVEDKVSITTEYGKIDCSYLKEETKLAKQMETVRHRQRFASYEAVKGTVYYVVYYKSGGNEGSDHTYTTVYLLMDIR